MFRALLLILILSAGSVLPGRAFEETLALPQIGDSTLRILSSNLLELVFINTKAPSPAWVTNWNLVTTNYQFQAPSAQNFAVTVQQQPVAIQSVLGFKRRPAYAPLNYRDLRIQNSLYLQLAQGIPDGSGVEVTNPPKSLWPATTKFTATADPQRYSPAIHVNQEGYVPYLSKKAMVGYYLGNAGEMAIPTNGGFQVVDAASGATVFQGPLTPRLDVGYNYSPLPYQKVCQADFSAFTNAGAYRVRVPGLGVSSSFRIDDGILMDFTRAYALGIYHQRCGTNNALPCTRFVHDPCHTNTVEVPLPQSSFQFTWNTISNYSSDYTNNPRHTAPQLKSPATQRYPFVRTNRLDVSGGHHDAGDYSKYTINSAALVHYLMFCVDALPGVAALDNLGIPESGDGVSDLLQETKWEADFLAKLQDTDGGFYFLVYPKQREYESNVLPDHGDPQVVWPKTTAVTAAGVAALAQCASSPLFRQQYPAAAAQYLQKAQLGWTFLTNAIARYGKDGAYQKITFYGDDFMHDDELAWAACEMYLATGSTNYQRQLLAWFPNPNDPNTYRWGWWRLYASYGCAIRSYAFAVRTGRLPLNKLDTNYLARCETEIKAAASDTLTRAQKNAYGTSFPLESKSYRTAGWYFSADQAFDMAVGYQLAPSADLLDALVSNLNYEGGCNPINICYITGLGWKRQREIVHQYAQNDRRALPPSGFSLGNIQAGLPWLANYGSELNALCFPDDNAATAPYPFYNRWADTFNVQTEFITVNLARSVATAAWLAGFTNTRTQVWSAVPGQIVIPAQIMTNQPATAALQVPGMDLSATRIVWEAPVQGPIFGNTFTFTPATSGVYWLEAEAQFSDGRRIFAGTNVLATNVPTTVSVTAPDAIAWPVGSDPAVFAFTRTGSTNLPLAISYTVSGTASLNTDFCLSPAGSATGMSIPAGATKAYLVVSPIDSTNLTSTKSVNLTLNAASGYSLGAPASAGILIAGVCAPITSMSNTPGGLSLTWAATPGKVYQVLYTDDFRQAWQTLSPELTATTATLSWADPASPRSQRFYRIAQIR